MKALDEAEQRMGCRLPEGFRDAYAANPVLTGIERWEMFEPREMFRLPDPERDAAPQIDAVVIGQDVGGNLLMLRFDAGALGETLWWWNHDGGAIEVAAHSLDALVREREEADDDESDDPYWGTDASVDAGGICAFCKSGMEGRRVCSVCGRRAGTKVEVDVAELRAASWAERVVDALVRDGGIEIAPGARARAAVTRIVALELLKLIDAMAQDDELASRSEQLLWRLEDSDSVVDIFIDEKELMKALEAARD